MLQGQGSHVTQAASIRAAFMKYTMHPASTGMH